MIYRLGISAAFFGGAECDNSLMTFFSKKIIYMFSPLWEQLENARNPLNQGVFKKIGFDFGTKKFHSSPWERLVYILKAS